MTRIAGSIVVLSGAVVYAATLMADAVSRRDSEIPHLIVIGLGILGLWMCYPGDAWLAKRKTTQTPKDEDPSA
jgi:hypothetical protein